MKKVLDYRKLAKIARNIADDMHDPVERARLTTLADDYERMARTRESQLKQGSSGESIPNARKG
ncbi:hypothetical protein [Sphingomicrobium nitratireducens]|uniref:hypothetical protein n=1 Tax=Sphingomicrobium nitratireducens TaxID=2964666 RepID=UPI00223FA46E|nr:hypothetical protein [Sphingomicrobium nitratireducens]